MTDFFGDPNEPLDPELEEYLCDSDFMGQMLKHPLVFQVPYAPQLAHISNKALKAKRQSLEECRAEGNWYTWIFLHEKPYRIEAFAEICHELEPKDYWTLLADVWTNVENLWQNQHDFDILVHNGPAECRECFTNEEDRERLAGLPETVEIYRGYNDEGTAEGWSWTLDRERAEWFARRLKFTDEPGHVAIATVNKTDIIGLMTDRGEDEVVVDPENVMISEIHEVV